MYSIKSVVITITITCILAVASTVFSATEGDLSKQIEEMRHQILILQNEISSLQGEGSLPEVESASNYVFFRDLSVGSRGEDVRQLQIVLNMDKDTQVASAGAGSKGNETTYFGELTKTAVVKFQNKYVAEVLAPVGLFVGTGYVGSSTRKKLNIMGSSGALKIPVKSSLPLKEDSVSSQKEDGIILNGEEVSFEENFLANSIPQSEELIVMFPSEYSGRRGAKIILYGSGFLKSGNDVYFGNSYKIKNVSTRNSGALSFTVPNDISFGKYDVWVVNEKGKSNETFFVVTNPDLPEPTIDSISPKEIKYGETITIRGVGFTKTNNTIRSSYDIIESIQSLDGETITIKVEPSFLQDVIGQMTGKGLKYDMWVYIVNKQGVSKDAGRFILST